MFGSLMGTSTVVSYVESAAGIAAGARSGVTAIVVGLLFLLSLPLASLADLIPVSATAPALILVGALMMASAADIDWPDPVAAIPAFLTILTIPLTFSIATGISFGFIASALLRACRRAVSERRLAAVCAGGALRSTVRLFGGVRQRGVEVHQSGALVTIEINEGPNKVSIAGKQRRSVRALRSLQLLRSKSGA